MQDYELKQKLDDILDFKAETKNIEFKKATGGTNSIYKALSAFSNAEGGIIIFGIDENDNYKLVNVYDVQDCQTKICEQCKEMEPEVRPIITPMKYEGVNIVCVEVPEMDYTQKPCYHKAKGLRKGAYIRIGNENEPMSEYEIYSYEAFKRQICDDIRKVERAKNFTFDDTKVESYFIKLKENRPNLVNLSTQELLKLNSFVVENCPTLIYVMMFSIYPQAIFPNLCVNATVVPGLEIGDISADGSRFINSKKIEGTLVEQINESINFVIKNMAESVAIDANTGKRIDTPEYPLPAIREAILNAIIHRDYSFHTENMPIQINMFQDRIEITNPGGLYGRLTIDELGKMQPDTRNPNIAKAMELLQITENRYSGIPTIKKYMKQANLPDPIFTSERGFFKVVLYNNKNTIIKKTTGQPKSILDFCREPKSLEEIQQFLGYKSKSYTRQNFVKPLVQKGELVLTIPNKLGSKYQKYITK